jgi:hypothetical protein
MAYRIERMTEGEWLWVIMPPYDNHAEASAAALRMEEQDGAAYRIIEEEKEKLWPTT